MLYSASRRTDMPAFYPDELVEKVIRSRKLDGIVMWTKDIRNLIQHNGLSNIITTVPTLVHYTVTGLAGSAWEPGVPALAVQLPALGELAERLPRGALQWRFDPIIPDAGCIERFRRVKEQLEQALLYELESVTVSFPDPYRHAVVRTKKAGLDWPAVSLTEKKAVLAELADVFRPLEEPLALCCEPGLLSVPGVRQARCIDGALFSRLYGLDTGALKKDAGQRAACGCMQSTDIGSYSMECRHGCAYCYAGRAE